MDEYISREAIIEELEEEIDVVDGPDNRDALINMGLKIALRDVKRLPAADVQPVNMWISVKDRLPDTPEEGLNVMYSDCCLVCDEFGWCGMAYYITDGQKSWWEFADAQNKNKIDWTEVSHWQPLPEPPKDGERE